MAFSQITLKISQDTARNIPVRPFASILQQTFAETLHIVREFMEMTDAPCTTMGRDHRRKLGVRALVLLKKVKGFFVRLSRKSLPRIKDFFLQDVGVMMLASIFPWFPTFLPLGLWIKIYPLVI